MYKKLFIPIIVTVILSAAAVYYYVFIYSTTYHRQAKDEVGIMTTADALSSKFSNNEKIANLTYLNKVLQVSGNIIATGTNQEGKTTLTLGSENSIMNVFVTLTNKQPLKLGDSLTIKGICNGLLSDVVVVDAVIVPQ